VIKSKNTRQSEATERNEAWAKLTPEQQIASLRKRRGDSAKQIARIQAKVKEVKSR
jgi:DNA-binding CsgD family transcriptional regulator